MIILDKYKFIDLLTSLIKTSATEETEQKLQLLVLNILSNFLKDNAKDFITEPTLLPILAKLVEQGISSEDSADTFELKTFKIILGLHALFVVKEGV